MASSPKAAVLPATAAVDWSSFEVDTVRRPFKQVRPGAAVLGFERVRRLKKRPPEGTYVHNAALQRLQLGRAYDGRGFMVDAGRLWRVAGRLGVADVEAPWSLVQWSAHDEIADDDLLAGLEREVSDGALTLDEVERFAQNEVAHEAVVRAVERLLSLEVRIEPSARVRLTFLRKAAADGRLPSFEESDLGSGLAAELFRDALHADLPELDGAQLLELASDLAGGED